MSNAGEAGVKKHSSWGAVGIDGLGPGNGSKSLGLYFLTDYQISHFTHFSSRFFSPVAPQGLTSPLQVPSLPRAWCCQCCCHAVWWAQTSPFCQLFVKIAAPLQALGTLRLVLLCQGFSIPHLDPQRCEVKRRDLPVTCLHPFFHPWNQIMG